MQWHYIFRVLLRTTYNNHRFANVVRKSGSQLLAADSKPFDLTFGPLTFLQLFMMTVGLSLGFHVTLSIFPTLTESARIIFANVLYGGPYIQATEVSTLKAKTRR
jgi:hypothetical protein